MNGLKFIRTRCNYSQAALAEELGVSRQTINMWECAKKPLSESRKNELKEFFGLETDEWFGEIDNDTIEKIKKLPMYQKNDEVMDVPYIEFSAEPWRLLNALVERLDNITEQPSEIVRKLICDGHKAIEYGSNKIITGQDNAIQMSNHQPITFIWGPPGTGKTETLAKIALDHIENGSRVLMLSYSNVSVDGAIMRVHKLSSHNRPGMLVRYGYSRQKELLDHEYLSSYNLAIHNHPDLLRERQIIIAERKKLTRKDQRYIQIEHRLSEIRRALSDEEKVAVKAARFVATTVSKAVIDSLIREIKFDVVIFDEASMAYIPQIVFSASLAKKHFICMGDFRQLPPIVQSNESSLLNGDIFQYCGITSAVDNGKNHEWLCMLNKQYRMHPIIADFASRTMYNGLLHSADEMENNRQDIVKNKPFETHAMAFADLSGMMSVCTKTRDNSRVNVLSAFVSLSLALDASQNHEVGIITPYHAQSRLLHAMVRDISDNNSELKPIFCATVHQFQGSEKDVIIYDAVDCYRMPYPGLLLTSTGNNYANRLFNVALTRSKGKFISVANTDYMYNKNLSNGLMFRNMIDNQRNKSSCLSGQALTENLFANGSNKIVFYSKMDGESNFIKDVITARREIRIDIPDKPTDDKFIAKLATELLNLQKKGIKVYLRAENKKTLPAVLKSIAIENPYIANPIAIIDKKTIWFGMPNSEATFKFEGRTIPTMHRPIFRFVGTHTAALLYGFMEMSKTTDQSKYIYLGA